MSQLYYLVVKGKPEGPFTVTQLKQKGLKAADFVKTKEMVDYKEAHEVPELRQILGFKKPAVIPQYFGSFDQRLLAAVIDWLTVSGACIVPVFLIVLLSPRSLMSMVLTVSLLVLVPLLNLVYHVVFEAGQKQGTFGKQVLKIKVTNEQGAPISVAHALGRNLSKIFSVATFGIGYLFNFFNKRQQCLHDMIAGTLVVKDRLI
ncbi:RDD family protein [Mucilaginibacter sp. RS28]|uniref:RDD family protein n=1 Tax=Mucilaginibacter straminoryzae TaxID=2932774 RepID=A0A9X2B8H2_9SPHI|nr:RDD family protein [Mucilaginibacter straminoryzae]MCJ8209461.1 RDD family protein [Mucilaginibacter straminoryzae]